MKGIDTKRVSPVHWQIMLSIGVGNEEIISTIEFFTPQYGNVFVNRGYYLQLWQG